MKRTPFAQWPCSIARTVDLLGDWWTPLVLRDAFYGIKRFDEFQRSLGIGRNVLTDRLRALVEAELLERVLYQEKPARHEYVLTERGIDFFPVLAAMSRWGDRWLAGEAGPPIEVRHESCGHDADVTVVCSHCGDPVRRQDVTLRLGPGYPPKLREWAAASGRFDTDRTTL
ncbi:winged helix-turn-helix transcriptional regulator [Amycolatopsis sp. H20-H5]|uniref:winged helix-turn-helix transcriptional regulator n=1 Tax=Amycolatopsis sp. H20-H5 TaxID=3046309 RepID=UPI002DBBDD89|nr:helix-turn-helix domain-containing protein [Amycolatopsis sp. H20-H5]MEC3974137.1 helix-turn-helix domain-containing protein [Amycolatopsis sp. H20-H5]